MSGHRTIWLGRVGRPWTGGSGAMTRTTFLRIGAAIRRRTGATRASRIPVVFPPINAIAYGCTVDDARPLQVRPVIASGGSINWASPSDPIKVASS